MSEHDAVEALERLGLSGYEAKTFIALQKLGSGTARDVADIADVPRSQVYSTAESLERRGLIDVQRTNPIRYRPLPIDEARAQLRDRLERETERAFDYIEDVRAEAPTADEPEAIWTATGRETIDTRIRTLLRDATGAVTFGVRDETLLAEDVERRLLEAAADGIDVAVISDADGIAARFEGTDVDVRRPGIRDVEGESGRILVVDGEAILISVLGAERTDRSRETAIWSDETNFARVLSRLVEGYLDPA